MEENKKVPDKQEDAAMCEKAETEENAPNQAVIVSDRKAAGMEKKQRTRRKAEKRIFMKS